MTPEQRAEKIVQAAMDGRRIYRYAGDHGELLDHHRFAHETKNAIAAAIREAVADVVADLNIACDRATDAMGMHGPCRKNSCKDCGRAWDTITAIKKKYSAQSAPRGERSEG